MDGEAGEGNRDIVECTLESKESVEMRVRAKGSARRNALTYLPLYSQVKCAYLLML